MTSLTRSARSSRRGTLRRFFGLPAAERRVVVRCGVLLARAGVLARLLPIGRVMAGIDARAARRTGARSVGADRAVQLLEATAARLRPRPRCLSTALAGYELLRERGVAARCVIGGRRGEPGFAAHAWLEAEGSIVLGDPVTAYQPIWAWPER